MLTYIQHGCVMWSLGRFLFLITWWRICDVSTLHIYVMKGLLSLPIKGSIHGIQNIDFELFIEITTRCSHGCLDGSMMWPLSIGSCCWLRHERFTFFSLIKGSIDVRSYWRIHCSILAYPRASFDSWASDWYWILEIATMQCSYII